MNSKLLIKYVNKWIALTSDRKKVLASAKSIGELEKKVDKLSFSANKQSFSANKMQAKPDVIYHHVLPINGNYSP